MKIQKDLQFEAIAFHRLHNGGHRQEFRNEEYCITMVNSKADRDSTWVKTFTADRFPGVVFHSGKELIEAFKKIE